MKSVIKLISVIVIISFTMGYHSLLTSATSNNQEVDIETYPDSYFFNISNMKPGDWTNQKLTILNLKKSDFTYNTEVKFLDGSEALYNEFLLTVSDSKGILYDGKLHNFEGISPRFLESGKEEDLGFKVEFPYELGNEFQGKGFEFELKFIAEQRNSNPDPGPNPNPDPGPNPNPDPGPNPNPDPGPNPNPDPGSNPSPDPNPNPNQGGDIDQNHNTDQDSDQTVLPVRPISKEELASSPVDGQILPSTSTNIYNYALIGAILIIVGAILIFNRRKKLKS